MLETVDVHKTFPGGVVALRGVSLEIARGETVALVGESGCGKSTLLRTFNRLVEPDSGRVTVDGRRVETLDPVALRRATGYVQQGGGLLPHWTVGRNVGLVAELLGWNEDRRRARTDELLELVGMEPATYRDRFPRALSGGQQQRVAFARALAADPDVVLLDEPFGALDALTRIELQRQFLDLERRLNKTMLLVTHDLDEAVRLADRIAVMQGGRLLQAGTAAQLRAAPAESYVERLLASCSWGER